MRPVARIAQSVEQGIENPRVLGSIPSPGTTLHQSHWSGVRNLTGAIGKVSDVVSLFHVHHDFSSRKGACWRMLPFLDHYI